MKQYNTKETKHSVKVNGKMSEQGADRAGNILAIAALIFAIGSTVAMIIYAIGTLQ